MNVIDKKICDLYKTGISMRAVADALQTNHKLVSRVLIRNGLHKVPSMHFADDAGDFATDICAMYKSGEKVSVIAKKYGVYGKAIFAVLEENGFVVRVNGRAKYRITLGARESKCVNISTHLRFDIDPAWFMQFDDLDKILALNTAITPRKDNGRQRWEVNDEWYKAYILRFYDCPIFNRFYAKHKATGDKYFTPSLDHIIPKSKGGDNSLDNLQFLSWFENRCKNNMSQEQWNDVKANIKDYLL